MKIIGCWTEIKIFLLHGSSPPFSKGDFFPHSPQFASGYTRKLLARSTANSEPYANYAYYQGCKSCYPKNWVGEFLQGGSWLVQARDYVGHVTTVESLKHNFRLHQSAPTHPILAFNQIAEVHHGRCYHGVATCC